MTIHTYVVNKFTVLYKLLWNGVTLKMRDVADVAAWFCHFLIGDPAGVTIICARVIMRNYDSLPWPFDKSISIKTFSPKPQLKIGGLPSLGCGVFNVHVT